MEFFIFLAPNLENLVALHCLFVCLLELADLFKKTFEFNADSTTYQTSMSRAFSHNFEGQLQWLNIFVNLAIELSGCLLYVFAEKTTTYFTCLSD